MDRLIKQLKKGNRKAQSQFYDMFSPLIMGICVRYVSDRDTADDVFQEAFIRIFQRIGQLEDPKAIRGWIKRITVNVALDHLKTIRFDDDVDDVGHELSDQFYSELIDRLSNEVILDAVNKLPEGYRLVFNLSVMDGFSHKEIANELGISESTSRSQLVCAR
ncbi:MAG TPA: hypothetical protein DHN29_13755, partial [Cytophagales bacterium]|nr:hypothetical protein [Cytophagales bacterium]